MISSLLEFLVYIENGPRVWGRTIISCPCASTVVRDHFLQKRESKGFCVEVKLTIFLSKYASTSAITVKNDEMKRDMSSSKYQYLTL